MKRKAEQLDETSGDQSQQESDDETSDTSTGSGPENTESGDDSSDSGSGDNQEVDVNFEFFDPKEIDFHGLKALLQTYLDGSPYNCSELVDTVIKQVFCSPQNNCSKCFWTKAYVFSATCRKL